MKQVLVKNGCVEVTQVPAPSIQKGKILIDVKYSLISTGTETAGIHNSGESLLKKALQQPEKVIKVLNSVQSQGLDQTVNRVKSKLSIPRVTGYSCAGRVLQVGEGIDDIRVGDLVACAGAGLANHAEIVLVPRNLLVRIPEGCDLRDASSVTLGSIAMQGVRRAEPRLGDIVAVIGLGLLGQITVQLLKANGCRVIGIDIDERRSDIAVRCGADDGLYSNKDGIETSILQITDGFGVDATIITASSQSSEILQQAMLITRKKGKVVIVGAVGMNIERSPFYEKEIDLLISCSYGPGRYDERYEIQGDDYPYAYVRWTENRNMSEYLHLLKEKKINLKPIIEKEYFVDEAPRAFEELMSSSQRPLAVLLKYPDREDKTNPTVYNLINARRKSKDGYIAVALIGAGSFAKGVHLPNLKKLSDQYMLRAVVSASGINAKTTAEQFGADYASTHFQNVLDDPEVDLVMICTRHHLHADYVLESLRAGKHVFVEKPLALTEQELNEIENFYRENESNNTPLLMTGFNRRFSPYVRQIYDLVSKRKDSMIINYRMNAGYIPLTHWVHTDEGGGRNIGEACHIYDLFTYLTGSQVTGLVTEMIRTTTGYYSSRDNFIVTFRFEDGSLANLIYTALGTSTYPKEQMEVFVDGKICVLNDYKELSIFGTELSGLKKRVADKGHFNELAALAKAIQTSDEWPIHLWQQVQATRMALNVENLLKG